MRSSFVVVGPGRVGTTMARALKDAGYRCLGLFGRTPEKVRASSEFVGAPGFVKLDTALVREAEIVFVGVQDDSIAATASELAGKGAVGPGSVLIHFSGLVTSMALTTPGVDVGGRASAHPNLAFADPSSALAGLKGAFFGIEGDERGAAVAGRIALEAGGIPVRIPSNGKTSYHLAAVFASNGMVVLASMAAEILREIGVRSEEAEKMTSKLVLSTARNLSEMGILPALTGPVVRGDAGTVASHLDAMKDMDPETRKIYCLLFKRMVKLGMAAGRGTEEKYAPITDLLEKNL